MVRYSGNILSYKAMILAAGLGTRLRPITDSIPKALVKVGGKTLLEFAIMHLAQYGVKEVVINVHHFADQIIRFLKDHNDFGLSITVSDESEQLLDTGGGLKNVSGFFQDGAPFFVRNVDIISNLDLSAMMVYHLRHKPLATLAVLNRATSRYLLFDSECNLRGWANLKTGERIESQVPGFNLEMLAFSGIQILSPEIFELITEEGPFSLTSLYLRLAKNNVIKGFVADDIQWRDVGKLPGELM